MDLNIFGTAMFAQWLLFLFGRFACFILDLLPPVATHEHSPSKRTNGWRTKNCDGRFSSREEIQEEFNNFYFLDLDYIIIIRSKDTNITSSSHLHLFIEMTSSTPFEFLLAGLIQSSKPRDGTSRRLPLACSASLGAHPRGAPRPGPSRCALSLLLNSWFCSGDGWSAGCGWRRGSSSDPEISEPWRAERVGAVQPLTGV